MIISIDKIISHLTNFREITTAFFEAWIRACYWLRFVLGLPSDTGTISAINNGPSAPSGSEPVEYNLRFLSPCVHFAIFF